MTEGLNARDFAAERATVEEARRLLAQIGAAERARTAVAAELLADRDAKRGAIEAGERSFINDDLDAIGGLVVNYLVTMQLVDELKPLEAVAVGELEEDARASLQVLRNVTEATKVLTERENGVSAIEHPEFMMVRRLRLLGVSWAKIAEATDVNAAGLHKRWAHLIEQPSEEA